MEKRDSMPQMPTMTIERIALLGQLLRYGITGVFASLVNIGIYHASPRTAAIQRTPATA